MSGGMSHIDTFDPKPGAETGGPTQAIKTSAEGVRIAENLPLLANHANKVAVLRGMTSTTGRKKRCPKAKASDWIPRRTPSDIKSSK